MIRGFLMLSALLIATIPFLPFQHDVAQYDTRSQYPNSINTLEKNEKLFLEESLTLKLLKTAESFLNNLDRYQTGGNSKEIKEFLSVFEGHDFKDAQLIHLKHLVALISEQRLKLEKIPHDNKWISDLFKFQNKLISALYPYFSDEIEKLIPRRQSPPMSFLSFLDDTLFGQIAALIESNKLKVADLACFSTKNVIKKAFPLLSTLNQNQLITELLLSYDYKESSRTVFKKVISQVTDDDLKSIALDLYNDNKANAAEILFAHISSTKKNTILDYLAENKFAYTPPLPGRLGSDKVYRVKLGDAEMYFFMDLEKYDLARNMANQVENNLMLSMAKAEFPLPTVEVAATATMFRKPLGYDQNLNPIDVDPLGTKLIDTYTQKTVENIEKRFNCNISTLTREMNLVVSHDAMRFHRDQLPLQYAFLNKAGLNFPKCLLAQDLTLMDWSMPPKSFSGTLMRDGADGDIFFILQFPNEVTSNFTLDPPVYPEDGTPPVYPGATTLPYHSPFAPVDYEGKYTSGSGRGKRISSVVRGIILDKDLDVLRHSSISLELNKPAHKSDSKNGISVVYKNGIEIHPLSKNFAKNLEGTNLIRRENNQHVEVLAPNKKLDSFQKQALSKLLGVKVKGYNIEYYKIIKRTSGFTRLEDLPLDLSDLDFCIIVNRSALPKHYEYTHVGEDFTSRGAPWIQMYFLPPSAFMKVTAKHLKNFCLTPIEELFYRNPNHDAEIMDIETIHSDFHSELDLFILRKK